MWINYPQFDLYNNYKRHKIYIGQADIVFRLFSAISSL
jgi:hypothetical protein